MSETAITSTNKIKTFLMKNISLPCPLWVFLTLYVVSLFAFGGIGGLIPLAVILFHNIEQHLRD